MVSSLRIGGVYASGAKGKVGACDVMCKLSDDIIHWMIAHGTVHSTYEQESGGIVTVLVCHTNSMSPCLSCAMLAPNCCQLKCTAVARSPGNQLVALSMNASIIRPIP